MRARVSPRSALKFRNLGTTPDAPVESWPFEGVLAAVERGSLPDWGRLAKAIGVDPWGAVARQVEEALEISRPYGTYELLKAVVAQARRRAAEAERLQVAKQMSELLARSGLSRAEFASRLGTSASRLSTYISGKVTPSAALMARAGRVGDMAGKFLDGCWHDGPMTDSLWHDTDTYLAEHLVEDDKALESALQESAAAGLPAIAVSPLQGKFLYILARLIGARRVLEVGTLGGYSAIWMGRALGPEGRLVSLEVSPEHARVARENLARAGLGEVAEVVVGPALESLPRLLEQEGPASFDLTFIDADKTNNPRYWEWALRLTRLGGVIVVDNVVREGQVSDASSTDAAVVGSRQVIEAIGAAPSAVGTALQTVGVKGYDGFAIALVTGPDGTP